MGSGRAEGSDGNGGGVERGENQKQVFHPFPRSLRISQTARDSHIPTDPAVCLPCWAKEPKKNWGPWKSGNRKARFPLSHRPKLVCDARKNINYKDDPNREKENSTRLRRPSVSGSSCIGMESDFRIILGLENATIGDLVDANGAPWCHFPLLFAYA